MARRATGEFIEHICVDGSRTFAARVTAYGNRYRIDLGDEHQGVTSPMARVALHKVVTEIELGIWEPAEDASEAFDDGPEPSLAEAAAEWMTWKRGRNLRARTIEHLNWALDVHLIPHFGKRLPSAIDLDAVKGYTDMQIARRAEIKTLRAKGLKLEGPNGGTMREMSARSINDTLDVLTELLTWADGRGWGAPDDNAAAGWRLKEQPRVTFALEPDELADLIAAASAPRPYRRQAPNMAARVETIVRLRDQDVLSWKAIAQLVGVSVPTAIYHYQARTDPKLFKPDHAKARADRAFICALAWSGARVTELCKLDVQQVDVLNAKFRIPDSKTKTGIRDVDLSPWLIAVVSEYFASRPGLGLGDPAFPDGNETRRNKDSVNQQLLKPAVEIANELRINRGARAIQNVTAHVMRRTYITLAFEALHPLPYVMAQVGHSDSRMTTEVYAEVCARRDRSKHMAAFDRLLAGEGLRTEPTLLADPSLAAA